MAENGGHYYKPGAWLAICDVCGLRFKSTELKKDWRGLMVDDACYELRHPQDFLRVRPDTSSIPWSRPEGEDVFIQVCYIWDESAYADLGVADCMVADYTTPFTYARLVALKSGIA